jgi:hypothetical protein
MIPEKTGSARPCARAGYAAAPARSGVPGIVGAADGRQGQSRAGSSRSCRSRGSRTGRTPGRPAREPGRAADPAVHHAAGTWHG